jgi:hypothetical protein
VAHLRSSRGQLAGPLTEGKAAAPRFSGRGGGFPKKQSRLAAARAAAPLERSEVSFIVLIATVLLATNCRGRNALQRLQPAGNFRQTAASLTRPHETCRGEPASRSQMSARGISGLKPKKGGASFDPLRTPRISLRLDISLTDYEACRFRLGIYFSGIRTPNLCVK